MQQDKIPREGKAICTLQYPKNYKQLHREKEETKGGRVCIKVLIMNSEKKFKTIWEKVSAEWL